MNGTITLSLSVTGKVFFLNMVLVLVSTYVFSQSCNCPGINACGECKGELTSLTLRFNGAIISLVTAEDDREILFNELVSPGVTFTITGSGSNGRFRGAEVRLSITTIPNAIIDTSCDDDEDPAYVGKDYGNFTVIAGISRDGGPICCSPAETGTNPPVVSNCPANISITLNGSECSLPVNWTAPTATDNCEVSDFTGTHDPGDAFSSGTTTVEYTATDNHGNTTTCSFTVTVQDNSKPVFSGCPGDITVEANTSCGAVVNWTPPTVSDQCTAALTTSHDPGDTFNSGTTKVTYTATDNSGNTSTCEFNVTVEDDGAPQLTGCPNNITVNADESCEVKVNWSPPTATDACSVTLTSDYKPGDNFEVGTTTVTYTATDGAGNTSTCQFNVIVEGESEPVIEGCPEDITVEANEVGEAIATWEEPATAASCGNITLTSTHKSGDVFPAGTTEVEYVARDDKDNSATCKFKVIVTYEDIIFDIAEVVTPDGDGINDEWTLKNIEKFSNNKVVIIDRWGSMIYSASGYDNERVVWKGINNSGAVVPTGTYFYTIEVLLGEVQVKKRGFIEVIR